MVILAATHPMSLPHSLLRISYNSSPINYCYSYQSPPNFNIAKHLVQNHNFSLMLTLVINTRLATHGNDKMPAPLLPHIGILGRKYHC